MPTKSLKIDERNVNIILRICTMLYCITLLLLVAAQLYRQFVLLQPTEEWEDIANIITLNILVLIGAGLYLGGIIPQRIRLWHILALYGTFVLVGLAFTVFKYTVLLDQQLSLADFKGYFVIVTVICGVLIAAWSLLAYLGKKRLDRQIE